MTVVKHTPGASKALRIAIKELEDKTVKAGWFDTTRYDDGTPAAYVATIQEFGYPAADIPPRPFMRPTVDNKTPEWRKLLAAGSKEIINGKLTVANMLESFGKSVAGDIQESIAAVTQPPLKASTIAARRRKRKSQGVSTKPLVDTGLMIQSVDSKVEG